jgi:leucyl aminopeptidase (aminopeptidase T)
MQILLPAQAVRCSALYAELMKLNSRLGCNCGDGSLPLGEFAVGTNIGIERVIGNILQDEKFPGIHIAFGNPYREHTGAPWTSGTHIDVVGLRFNIWLESDAGEEQIMRDGRFLITA